MEFYCIKVNKIFLNWFKLISFAYLEKNLQNKTNKLKEKVFLYLFFRCKSKLKKEKLKDKGVFFCVFVLYFAFVLT